MCFVLSLSRDLFSSLTSVEAPPKDEIEKDLHSVKDWIDAKEEL